MKASSRRLFTLSAIAFVGLVSYGAVAEDAAADAEPAKAAPLVGVIADDDLPLYRRVTAGLAVELRGQVAVENLRGDPKNASSVLNGLMGQKPAAIVAVGPRALVAAKGAASKVPVVYCMVPRIESYGLAGEKNLVGVRLEVPLQRQLGALKSLMPAVTRVGVVHNPDTGGSAFEEVSRVAREMELEAVGITVSKPAQTKGALNKAAKVDALIMVSDPTVLNITSFEAMLEYASASKVPLVALDARFVERGALLGFSLDETGLGRQVGRMVNDLVAGAVTADKLGLQEPDALTLGLNLSTADQIGAPSNLRADLLELAAREKLGLRVYR